MRTTAPMTLPDPPVNLVPPRITAAMTVNSIPIPDSLQLFQSRQISRLLAVNLRLRHRRHDIGNEALQASTHFRDF